jgi:hypothetical protein
MHWLCSEAQTWLPLLGGLHGVVRVPQSDGFYLSLSLA